VNDVFGRVKRMLLQLLLIEKQFALKNVLMVNILVFEVFMEVDVIVVMSEKFQILMICICEYLSLVEMLVGNILVLLGQRRFEVVFLMR
jgi:hypothetical protein